jgi:hypothetical protein
MTLKGDFETLFLASILQLLCNDGKTGVLRVTNDEDQTEVYLQEGAIIYASGSRKEERLGRLLTRHKYISANQLEECLETASEQGHALGKVLVDNGYISTGVLKKIIRKQAENLLFNMLLWEKGHFEYQDAPLDLDGLMVTRLNAMKIIMEATRRIDEISVLAKQIPSDRLLFQLAPRTHDQEDLKLNSIEWHILALVDGIRTVREIIAASGDDEFTVYKALYSLVSSGLIEKRRDTISPEASKDTENVSILVVYMDVLEIIHTKLSPKLGDFTATYFEDCKPEKIAGQNILLKHFHPSYPKATNLDHIQDAMRTFENPAKARAVLIDSFNAFIKNILDKAPAHIGKGPTKDLHRAIQRTLAGQ